jgi:hypothetical protein
MLLQVCGFVSGCVSVCIGAAAGRSLPDRARAGAPIACAAVGVYHTT